MQRRSLASQGNSGTFSPVTRRAILVSGMGISTSALSGCLGDDDGTGDGDDGDDDSTGDDDGDTDNGEDFSVAIISSNAGFDDRAFNDMAREGLREAREEYGFELNEVEETSIAAFEDTQAEVAETGADLIVLVGFQHTEPLQTNAEEYPDTKWMLINDNIDRDNVAGYVWANHEMSYLAGVQAGTMTSHELEHEGNSNDPDNNHVGFVGGEEVPLIEAFERAYVAGAEWVDSDIEVSVGYAGSFDDPADGEEVAASQYQDGADIIYHAAAGTGPGIFDAAQQANRFAIGVDADQSVTLDEFSDVIIGSAVKYIDQGTYDCARAVVEDDWESVNGQNVLGLPEEAVDLIIGQEFQDQLPDELHDNLDEAKQQIIDGEIDVPCAHDGC